MSTKITKDMLPDILKDLGKEYRKRAGKRMPAELVITGGAAVLAKYGFRESSYDLDAIIRASGAIKDASLAVRDKYNLEQDWLNDHFMRTDSYSEKLYEHSDYYRTFSNVLTVRIVKPEYLLVTKLRAARSYKHDLSDIVGIVTEEKARNPEFMEAQVMAAYRDLYGTDAKISQNAYDYMCKAFDTDMPNILITSIRKKEETANQLLTTFQNKYPTVLTKENVTSVLTALQEVAITKESETPSDNVDMDTSIGATGKNDSGTNKLKRLVPFDKAVEDLSGSGDEEKL